ncbi:hypothetical protein C8Q79DRAFT_27636 [Trametes meyenii]|nr:hypothetical protein C8Q79DRAFT_27636 [Trametes meyenii]
MRCIPANRAYPALYLGRPAASCVSRVSRSCASCTCYRATRGPTMVTWTGGYHERRRRRRWLEYGTRAVTASAVGSSLSICCRLNTSSPLGRRRLIMIGTRVSSSCRLCRTGTAGGSSVCGNLKRLHRADQRSRFRTLDGNFDGMCRCALNLGRRRPFGRSRWLQRDGMDSAPAAHPGPLVGPRRIAWARRGGGVEETSVCRTRV